MPSGLSPVEVQKDPRSRHVDAVVFAHRRDPSRRVVVRAAYTIDAEVEGDVTHLAGVSTTLRREGRGPSADPTRDDEAYAGRLFTPLGKLGSLGVAGGDLLAGSTQVAEGDMVHCFLDGREIEQLRRTPAGGTLVGLVNGGGEASRFDNFEVRAVR